MLDRSAILSEAHRLTRRLIANGSVQPYRVLFVQQLKFCWYAHKLEAANAAAEVAIPPLPDDVAVRVADLRLIASTQNFTSYGAAQFRALNAEADLIERAARCMMIPAQGQHHAVP